MAIEYCKHFPPIQHTNYDTKNFLGDLSNCFMESAPDRMKESKMKKAETHKHLSELIRVARQKKGFATLRELYREKSPSVDYQTWLHAEAGRRIPHPNSLKEIGDILGVDKEDLIIAYCKDKFSDAESHRIVDSFLFK